MSALRTAYDALVVDPEFGEVFERATGQAPTLMTGEFMQDTAGVLSVRFQEIKPTIAGLQEELWNKIK